MSGGSAVDVSYVYNVEKSIWMEFMKLIVSAKSQG